MCTITCLKWKQTDMEKLSVSHGIQSFKQYLNEFCENLKEKGEDTDSVPRRCPNPHVTTEELEGECIDWVLNYLSTRECPPVLALCIAREVFIRISGEDLEHFLYEKSSSDGNPSDDESQKVNSEETQNEQKNRLIEYNAEDLQKNVLDLTEKVCKTWSEDLPDLAVSNTYNNVSFNAIKNTRRKMEDAHVIVPDLNALFGLKDEPTMSFYGVFDGHAGTDASLFTSKHIHRNLVHHGCLDKNPAEALRSVFRVTDEQFIPKAKREKWRSGTTGVTALIRDKTAYLSWLGDSQAIVVKDGQCVTHMEPHKPDRQDERDRIEAQGGFVLMVEGMWRVGGNIAVSRAIGDVNYKPFISSEAEVITVDLDGTEEYMVLACDGLWDVVTEQELPKIVYNLLTEADGDQSSIAKSLVQYAKDNDSTDNISVIIVFFRESISEPKSDTGLFNFQFGDSSQGTDQSGNGSREKGDKSKDSDGKEDKGDNSVNQSGNGNKEQDNSSNNDNADTINDLNHDIITDQGLEHTNTAEDKSHVIESNKHNVSHNATVGDSAQLDYANLETEGEGYVRIGHILGLESPESTEFINNFNNQIIPEYESGNHLMLGDEDSPIEREVDLDYYGVFNSRLVDGPFDLSSFDDQNSSILLKDIADSMYNQKYAGKLHKDNDVVLPVGMNRNHREQVKRVMDPRYTHKQHTSGPKKELVQQGAQKPRKGFSNSPICWSFTGKNKASVQNHRLNLAARGSLKGSNPTPGEIKLAAKAPHHLPERKFAQLTVSKENILNTSSNTTNMTLHKKDPIQPNQKSKSKKSTDVKPGFTVFGSKTNLQTETQKFHTSWRPRKPLKPLSTVVFELPPTPFTNKPLSNYQKH